jgi:hypothetical protein
MPANPLPLLASSLDQACSAEGVGMRDFSQPPLTAVNRTKIFGSVLHVAPGEVFDQQEVPWLR